MKYIVLLLIGTIEELTKESILCNHYYWIIFNQKSSFYYWSFFQSENTKGDFKMFLPTFDIPKFILQSYFSPTINTIDEYLTN